MAGIFIVALPKLSVYSISASIYECLVLLPNIRSDALSASMTAGQLVLPEGNVGIA